MSNIVISPHSFENKHLLKREAVKRRETRWSCRSRFLKAPGEHFKTSLTPDKAKDFFTDCRTKIAAVTSEHWHNNVFRNTLWSVVRTFSTLNIKQHQRIPQHRHSQSSQWRRRHRPADHLPPQAPDGHSIWDRVWSESCQKQHLGSFLLHSHLWKRELRSNYPKYRVTCLATQLGLTELVS